ncbi:MAG TPA: hypothetical protein VH092_18015 [Urbifossiella sp.]|jgi:hypothetical protein|nr:hypothetical protein [Urbifossiella sp.]
MSGKKTEYGVPAEVFVAAWEAAGTIQEVYETLKAYSEQHGNPVMPRPIIAARASEYREKVPLKKMPRISDRNLDAKALTDLVEKLRAGKAGEVKAEVKVDDAAKGNEPVLTRAQVEEVVIEVLERLGLVEKGARKGRRSS